jgi:NitT/TauT family transport system permease protein
MAAVLVLAGLWQLAVIMTGATIFPSPGDVIRGLGELAGRGILWSYIGDSLVRVMSGYLAAVLGGIPLGMALGWFPTLGRIVNPIIQLLRPISPLAWMPLAVIWFGVSNAPSGDCISRIIQAAVCAAHRSYSASPLSRHASASRPSSGPLS